MIKAQPPREVMELLDLAHPGSTELGTWQHGPGTYSMVLQRADGRIARVRWVLGQSGRYTMNPVREEL